MDFVFASGKDDENGKDGSDVMATSAMSRRERLAYIFANIKTNYYYLIKINVMFKVLCFIFIK